MMMVMMMMINGDNDDHYDNDSNNEYDDENVMINHDRAVSPVAPGLYTFNAIPLLT
jgi:hypothetical protein